MVFDFSWRLLSKTRLDRTYTLMIMYCIAVGHVFWGILLHGERGSLHISNHPGWSINNNSRPSLISVQQKKLFRLKGLRWSSIKAGFFRSMKVHSQMYFSMYYVYVHIHLVFTYIACVHHLTVMLLVYMY